MKIIVFGGDGYCGPSTVSHLSGVDHEATIVDDFVERQNLAVL